VLAERFGVSLGAVCTWLQQWRNDGRRGPRPMGGGGKPPLGGTDPAVLAELVAERRDATLAEYADMLAARTGQRFSRPALCRALARAGLRRKKRRSGRRSRSAPTLPRRVRLGGRR
jgi:transposase